LGGIKLVVGTWRDGNRDGRTDIVEGVGSGERYLRDSSGICVQLYDDSIVEQIGRTEGRAASAAV